MKKKATIVTPMKVGMRSASLLSTNLSMLAPIAGPTLRAQPNPQFPV
jgi:hypothetical protein